MKANGKLHIFLIFLAGALVSVMIVMMRLGGSVNFQEFMSAGEVYDFEPSKLQKNSKGWLYEWQNGGHRLLKKKAQIKYELDDLVHEWGFLYITVEQLSVESVEGLLRYYDEENKKVLEQPITLVRGRNLIHMDSTVPINRIGIMLLNAKGEFISISEMQIRTTVSWFTVPHFLKLFVVVFAVVMAVLFVLSFLLYRLRRGKRGRVTEVLLLSMQSGMQVVGDFLGSRMGGKLYPHQKESMRRFLFSLLFVWMIAGNVADWTRNAWVYRYHVLICALLLLVISFVSWEKPLQHQFWCGPLMKSWLCIWLGIILCALFVEWKLESVTGYAMFFAGGVFIFFWQNMEKPQKMLRNLMESLEITFFLGVAYCMIFRMKQPAIDYSGIFKSPEELAMYAVLMVVVFLTELDWLISDRITAVDGRNRKAVRAGGTLALCIKNITGMALALFFLLRSGHALGIAVVCLLGILYIPHMLVKISGMAKKCRIMFLNIIAAAVVAYACVGIVFINTKYLPEVLGMDVEYRNEQLLTKLEGEEKQLYLMQYPGSIFGVRTKAIEKLPIIWRNYARRLNLFGHNGYLNVFRRGVLPHNGYLDMAYRHGIFILLPYAAFQITMVALGIKCAFRKKGKRNIYMMFLGISYLCFSFGANVEISWGHPFWLCYYLSVGYLGRMETEKT